MEVDQKQNNQQTCDANFTANVRVRKRMELLKRLVPGSELIDNNDYLIKETLDYIYCLSPSAS
ncbi:hypothetical protein IGI04_009811 [Brassica rapa subsp. trilocularis]|uniref:BHLH domain-containing protein n=1 Tax=Brassica rapa subsp. trilocularis TaxID=1813537 RepID=A0ABQ7MYD1_BRACM|nr:hypothetical protein IGI04_009811 [Brassica rapa subsp. trilocularis]